jgi:hypothetical protein
MAASGERHIRRRWPVLVAIRTAWSKRSEKS